eukprot:2230724-Amphidinium_carterae.1
MIDFPQILGFEKLWISAKESSSRNPKNFKDAAMGEPIFLSQQPRSLKDIDLFGAEQAGSVFKPLGAAACQTQSNSAWRWKEFAELGWACCSADVAVQG